MKPFRLLRVMHYERGPRTPKHVPRSNDIMSQKDYYQILQVPHGSSAVVIESAYWNLARKYNASLAADPTLARLIGELNDAYRVLATPDLRRQYDKSLAIAVGSGRHRRRRFLWFGRARREPQGKTAPSSEAVAPVAAPAPERKPKPEPVAAAERALVETAPDMRAPVPTEQPFAEHPRAETQRVKRESASRIRWEMPPLQSFVVSVGVAVMFILALAAGADPGLTLILGGLTVFFALFPWRFGRLPAIPDLPERSRQDDQLQAQIIRESTAAIVARWRQGPSGRPPSQPPTDPPHS